ncbi:MAG: hypothetical protein ABW252_03250 [Polyangiales bacterium]
MWSCAGPNDAEKRLDDDAQNDERPDGNGLGGADDDGDDDDKQVVRSDAGTDDEDATDALDEDAVPPVELALSTTEGAAPLDMAATPPASTPELQLTALYDWGEGAGFEQASTHRYTEPGEYTVTQEVLDEGGNVVDLDMQRVTVTPFKPVGFSTTDKTPCANVSPDGLSLEARDWGPCGARTSASIAPGSGVYYFEAKRLGGGSTIGVGTASTDFLASVSAASDAMGILPWGPIRAANAACSGADSFNMRFADAGFVIDYRGASPTVHVISRTDDESGVAVRASCAVRTSAPVFGIYAGERRMVGYEIRLNTGADTVNVPFAYGEQAVKAALNAANASDTARALVMGFGGTRAGRPGTPPSLTLAGPTVVNLGQSVTLTGTAQDAQDGNLSAKIAWSDLSTLHHTQPNATNKASYTFTASEVGRHPIRATVTDSDGVITTAEQVVEVRGTPQVLPFAQVKLVPDATTGSGIVVSPDGLSVHFEENQKMGIRANQALYGGYWYFEVRRNTPVRNMGIGVVVKEGSLNPYTFHDVPWSMSVNVSNGFWHNLIGEGAYTPAADRNAPEVYGIAVDYRGVHPTVHVIARGAVQGTMELPDVWTPLYPLVYGNGGGPAGALDYTVNFGASAFTWNPAAILGARGTGIQLGWGR